MYNYNRNTWASKLVALLRGDARDAVMRLKPEDMGNYEIVKAALLNHFRLDADAYRQKFRTIKKGMEESFCQFLGRLRTCFARWCLAAGKDENNVEDVVDLMLQEQFFNGLTFDYVTEVKRSNPSTAREVAELATKYAAARKAGKDICSGRGNQFERAKKTQGPNIVVDVKSVVSEVGSREGHQSGPFNRGESRGDVKCFKCGKTGHMARHCKQLFRVQAVGCQGFKGRSSEVPTLCGPCARKPFNPRCIVEVNGQPVNALRDTGAEYVFVAKRLIPEEAYTGQTKNIMLADTRCRYTVPVAIIELKSPFVSGQIEVLVMNSPVEDVLIGEFVQRVGSPEWESVPVYAAQVAVGAVTTRGQEKQDRTVETLQVPGIELGLTATELISQQDEDPTLSKARKAVESKECITVRSGKVKFEKKKGILVRKFRDGELSATQVCVPKKLRTRVMSLAHDAPMAGHLATKKTVCRLSPHFYWPGMFGDIRRYCQSCIRCQKTCYKGKIKRVPMVKMPVIGVPFQRVGVDIIGPIKPRSESGKKFVLVMVDFATRYPEATPLKEITAKSVADALWVMWSRTGIPGEVLTDRGTQFMSKTMEEVYDLLAIKGLRTTAYHPQCNGLVERFNGTLKAMLRRLIGDKPKEWDRWIPALLFAYREVPQESTGFAPFELLYGRTVRGPLQLLKESWLHPEEPELKTVAEYVVKLKERITETCAIAERELEKASSRYKKYFDKGAKPRSFKEGSKVLVLRPTKNNRLELAWKGPYTVKERAGPVDYVVRVQGKEKRYHANLLKQFVERVETGVATIVLEDGEPEWDIASGRGRFSRTRGRWQRSRQ
eukprot:TRINITY_DN746_c0_g1_i1.p1 TRINITY_DN746_c0_g1~~TRINITY_DN746_c0_g1_i1.p1  ORF type:complete len:924 (-),score=128.82 TRINITY_DN746_c0_g1_i1:522-3017(-)